MITGYDAFISLCDGGPGFLHKNEADEFPCVCTFDPVRDDDGLPFRVHNGAWSGIAYMEDGKETVTIRFTNPVTGPEQFEGVVLKCP